MIPKPACVQSNSLALVARLVYTFEARSPLRLGLFALRHAKASVLLWSLYMRSRQIMLLLAERSDSSRADLICVGAKTRYKLFSMFSPFVLVCLFLCVLNQCSPKEQVNCQSESFSRWQPRNYYKV